MEKIQLKKIYIGTSGWIYSHWDGIFYPKKLNSQEKLKFYSKHFLTAEINYSFYHLPKVSTYQKWYLLTPKNFLFAPKVSRFITHIKRLKGVKLAFKTFFENALTLKEKLGPFLIQLPPSFKFNEENFKRLKEFFEYLKKLREKNKKYHIFYALEIRNKTFDNKKFFDLLKKYNLALVISDSSRWIKIEKPELADFIYIRFHGPDKLFASKYSKEYLKNYAQKIKKWSQKKLVFVYFNNDFSGFALENAKDLIKMLRN